MRFLGLNITREKALAPVAENRGGWFRLLESYPGAWSQNVEVSYNAVLAYHAVYACITLIASDIAKLRVKLVAQDDAMVWTETTNPAYSPVLRKPNPWQTRNQYWENYILSKLMRGNTYVLKQRDARGVVSGLYVLDPTRTQVLVSDDGAVFYDLQADNVSAITERIVVPAREIIHDRFNCLFHPLVGTSPIFANGLAATQGLRIQDNSAVFFGNRSMPGGILTAPGAISNETAARLKAAWDANYSGANAGKVAVVGDGLKFEPISVSAEDSQLIEQLKWTAEVICSTFHVPLYKLGLGPMPTNNNVQTLNVEYYATCLQSLIEAAEECLDEGLGIGYGDRIGVEFDLDGLLRMDTLTQVQSIKEAIGAGFMAPNEGRRKMDLKPVDGGGTPYLQQQNYSLAALAKRDAQDDPFGSKAPVAPSPPDPAEPNEPDLEEEGKALALYMREMLAA